MSDALALSVSWTLHGPSADAWFLLQSLVYADEMLAEAEIVHPPSSTLLSETLTMARSCWVQPARCSRRRCASAFAPAAGVIEPSGPRHRPAADSCARLSRPSPASYRPCSTMTTRRSHSAELGRAIDSPIRWLLLYLFPYHFSASQAERRDDEARRDDERTIVPSSWTTCPERSSASSRRGRPERIADILNRPMGSRRGANHRDRMLSACRSRGLPELEPWRIRAGHRGGLRAAVFHRAVVPLAESSLSTGH